jgi:hypothetical protein
MQVRSLSNSVYDTLRKEGTTDGLKNSIGHRFALLTLNAIPIFHLSSIFVLCHYLPNTYLQSGVVLLGIYLIPPIMTRLILSFVSIREGSLPVGSRDFYLWWTSFQWQSIFNRLPWLEELIRLVPGLYSMWLRCWGAKIGRFTFWAPGLLILDRPFLRIGNDVVFGAGVRLNGHVAETDSDGNRVLLLGTIIIGSNVNLGGYSLLTAGTEILSNQTTKAFLLSPPFTKWEQGKRTKNTSI